MAEPGTVEERIKKRYAELSPSLRRAADLVLKDPLDIATRSLRQVASASEVAPPTLSRLARALGYKDYAVLREQCRREASSRELSFAKKADALFAVDEQKTRGRGAFMLAQARSSIANITALVEAMDLNRLADAADDLASARRVLLLGAMSGAAFMTYTSYVASITSVNWQMLDLSRSTNSSALLSLEPGDAVLALSHHPYSRQTVNAVRIAHDAGAKVTAITDSPASPLLPNAAHSFIVRVESPQFFPSHAATLVLLESLLGMVVRRQGKHVQARMAAVESLNRALGEYYEA